MNVSDAISTTLIIYLVTINLVTFFVFAIDKSNAYKNKRRTPEKTLFILALIGGSIGTLLGMKTFRHKTKKLSFQAVLAIILTLQILLVYTIFFT